MNRLLTAVIATFLFSCEETKPLMLAKVLASQCYWDRTGERQVIGGLNSCYRFLPDGQCYFYYYKFYNKKRTDSIFRYEDDDVVIPESWSVIGDTVLIARGTQYKVLAYSHDSVVIEGSLRDTMVLRKNCNTSLSR